MGSFLNILDGLTLSCNHIARSATSRRAPSSRALSTRLIWKRAVVAALLLAALPVMSVTAQSPTRPRQLNEQLQRAQTALLSGSSLLEAKARVDRVVSALPEDAEARVLRAEILLSMGRDQDALVDARRATELAPANGAAHLAFGEASLRTGDAESAELAMNRAAQLLVDDSGAHVRLSRLARMLNLGEQAIAFARIAVALAPESAVTHYELARAFIATANTDAAASVLASGLRDGLLSADIIAADSVLNEVARHNALKGYLPQ